MHEAGQSDAFLRGQRVLLRALRAEDVDGPYPGWLDDPDVSRGNSHHVFPYTREAALDYVGWARSTRDALVLAIEVDGRHVGNVALDRIHPVHRSAELTILIGDRSVWGTGVASEACALLVAHGFRALGLHRVACGTYAHNVGMRSLATKLGMREEGVRRAAAFKDGQHVDVVEYGLLRDEWLEAA